MGTVPSGTVPTGTIRWGWEERRLGGELVDHCIHDHHGWYNGCWGGGYWEAAGTLQEPGSVPPGGSVLSRVDGVTEGYSIRITPGL
jgi:hypothetical protein